jgi:hypothetical protein
VIIAMIVESDSTSAEHAPKADFLSAVPEMFGRAGVDKAVGDQI